MLSENARKRIKEKLSDEIEESILNAICEIDPSDYINYAYINERVQDKLGPYIEDEISDMIDECIDELL